MKQLYEAPEVQVIEMEVGGPVMDGTVNPLGGYEPGSGPGIGG